MSFKFLLCYVAVLGWFAFSIVDAIAPVLITTLTTIGMQ